MEKGNAPNFELNKKIVLESGQLEDPTKTTNREREELRSFLAWSPELAKKNPELSKIIERIDFHTLRGIFEETARKCGVDPHSLNFVAPEQIVHVSLDPSGACYMARENAIGLSYDKLKGVAARLEIDFELLALDCICHEETHATARIEYHLGGQVGTKLGFQRAERTPERNKVLFSIFNEGITTKFGREVFRKYVHRMNIKNDEGVEGLENALRKDTSFYWGDSVKLVDAFIAKLSHETGVSEEVVWGAIVRGMFEGIDLDSAPLSDLFSEIIAPNFIDKLATMDALTIDGLIKELALPEQTPPPQTVVAKLLAWLSRAEIWKKT